MKKTKWAWIEGEFFCPTCNRRQLVRGGDDRLTCECGIEYRFEPVIAVIGEVDIPENNGLPKLAEPE